MQVEPSTVDTFIGAAIGASGVGVVGLLFFFVRQYFVNRDKKQEQTSDIVMAVRLEMAGFKELLKSTNADVSDLKASVKFISEKQMPRIFQFIDAPPRATDLNGGKQS